MFSLVASEVLLKSCLTPLLLGCHGIEDRGTTRSAAHGTQEAKRDRQEGSRARCLRDLAPVTGSLQTGTVFTVPPSSMAY